jgi:hypothetical protein
VIVSLLRGFEAPESTALISPAGRGAPAGAASGTLNVSAGVPDPTTVSSVQPVLTGALFASPP